MILRSVDEPLPWVFDQRLADLEVLVGTWSAHFGAPLIAGITLDVPFALVTATRLP
ncbi:MAG TPA: hypothetical protein VNJ51_01440 [Candidatus Dormibacteraeota bacterium]|nr:hypothetical protein [Candidatus Dormibacteraeota bacterium]